MNRPYARYTSALEMTTDLRDSPRNVATRPRVGQEGDHVDDDIGTVAAKLISVLAELIPVAEDLLDAGGEHGVGLSPVKDGDFVAASYHPHQGWADEVRPADDNRLHPVTSIIGGAQPPIRTETSTLRHDRCHFQGPLV